MQAGISIEALETLMADLAVEMQPAIRARLAGKIVDVEAARHFLLDCLSDPGVWPYVRLEHGDRVQPFRVSLDRLVLERLRGAVVPSP